MGSAMLRGWVAAGVSPDTFHVVDPVAENLPAGVAVSRASQEVARPFDMLLLGIKPQLLSSLAPDIASLLAPGAWVISILAGTTTHSLSEAFPNARIIRLMPNLAAAIGKSPLGVFAPNETELVKYLASHISAHRISKINNNENISMDPEIAKIFMEATHSTCKSYSKKANIKELSNNL